MATRTRDTAPGKEKRGTSPSFPRKAPNSKPSSPDKTPSDNKHVPNYLKPTISSAFDGPKQPGKKPVSSLSTDNGGKPNLARRRSFDKPPSPSLTPRSRVSPIPTPRSSSFSSKTSPKVTPDKLLKTPTKDTTHGGKRVLFTRSLSASKKTSQSNKKQEAPKSGSSSITKEQVNSPDKSETYKSDSLQGEIGQEEHESPVTVTDDELGDEVLVVEDKEPISITRQAEPENIVDEDVVTIESYTIPELPEVAVAVETKELPEDEPTKIEVSEQHIVHEDNQSNHTQTDEVVGDNSKAEVEVEALEGSETIESEEREMKHVVEVETDNEETKQEDSEKKKDCPVLKDSPVSKESPVMKDSPVLKESSVTKDSPVSNDVIEETASRLREQRKNKVKALAGAFETVISLQEPK